MSTVAEKAQRVGRVAKFLWRQRVLGFAAPEVPHFDSDTQGFFYDALYRIKSYLEYGSGGSTLFVSYRPIDAVSVEGDPYYARTVRKSLARNSRVRIIVPDIGMVENWGTPIFKSAEKGRRYVRAPWDVLNGFPELILIDGRYRVACALECASRAYSSGSEAEMLVDDYIGRPDYARLEQWLGEPEMVGRSALFRIGRREVDAGIVERFFNDAR